MCLISLLGSKISCKYIELPYIFAFGAYQCLWLRKRLISGQEIGLNLEAVICTLKNSKVFPSNNLKNLDLHEKFRIWSLCQDVGVAHGKTCSYAWSDERWYVDQWVSEAQKTYLLIFFTAWNILVFFVWQTLIPVQFWYLLLPFKFCF